MRIAFIGQKGIPGTQGGVERHTEELATRLAARGHAVRVYTRPQYTDPKLTSYRGVTLKSLPSIPTKHLDAVSHTFFATVHLLFHPTDAVIFQAIGPSSLTWLVRLFRPRIRVLGVFHCQDYYHAKWGRFARLYLHFGEWALHRFSHVVFDTTRILQARSRALYHREAVLLPNGVPRPQPIDPAIERKTLAQFNLTPNEYVVAVSRLVRHKGMHYLIAAFRKLSREKKLVIVGGGAHTDEYVDELHRQAAGDPRIIFTGFLTGEALQSVFRNAALFVHPSDAEGLPINVLEAMSFGMAPLLSDIPEHKEAAAGNAYFFKAGDVADLTRQLTHLLDPATAAERAKLGAAAQVHVVKNHDWEVLADRVLAYAAQPTLSPAPAPRHVSA